MNSPQLKWLWISLAVIVMDQASKQIAEAQLTPHQPVNLSETEAARAIVVRNDPNEQEHVILYDPSGDD